MSLDSILDKLAKADEVNFAMIAELASAVIVALDVNATEERKIAALESLRDRLAMSSAVLRAEG